MGLLTKLGLRRSNIWDRPTILDELLDSPLQAAVWRLYVLFVWLRGNPVRPPANRDPIRVVCLSDTHEAKPSEIPAGDLLIFAGDACNDGSAGAIQAQLDWLAALPHKHKVFVSGNHDSWFDIRTRSEADITSHADVVFNGVHHLDRKSTTLVIEKRRLNLYGAPDIPKCGPAPPHA